jgi:hypothetical protein
MGYTIRGYMGDNTPSPLRIPSHIGVLYGFLGGIIPNMKSSEKFLGNFLKNPSSSSLLIFPYNIKQFIK